MNESRLRMVVMALVLVAFFFGVAGWLQRLQSDLNWDEAHSYNAYARHPLTAIGLYLEPNNHPLESFYRSIFYGVLGITDLKFNRLPGLGILAAYLFVLGTLVRRLTRFGHWPGAIVLALGLLFAGSTQTQVLQLRGYFPSMVLLLTYFLVLTRPTPLLGAAERAPKTHPYRVFALISALLVFTVPTNVIFVPALWVGTVLAFPHPSWSRRWGALFRLGAGSAVIGLLFYIPIAVGTVLGINRMNQFPEATHPGFWAGVTAGTADLFLLGTPVGIPVVVFAAGVGLIGVLALALARDRTETRVSLIMLAALFLANGLFSGFLTAPVRVKSPMIVILWVALCLLVIAITRTLTPLKRLWVALTLAATGLLLLPAQADQVQPDRTPSEIVSLIDATCRPDQQFVLVAADTGNLWFYLSHRFGESHLIRGRRHIDETFSGVFEPTTPEDSAWKTRLRRFFFPELEQPQVVPGAVEVLVLITEVDYHPQATVWDHPILDQIGQRLTQVQTHRMGPYRVEIKSGED